MIESPSLSAPVSRPETTIAPLPPQRRIEAIDILRGIAILGIFLVNMLGYAGFRLPFEQMTFVDKASTVLIRFVAQGKFYPLFALLFGWGMAIQMERAARRDLPFVGFWVRRMLALLLIGLVHAILIWNGDILVTYALLGLPLVLFRRASDRVLLLAFILCLAVPVLISLPGPGEAFRAAYAEATAGARNAMVEARVEDVLLSGTYGQAVAARLVELRFTYANALYWATHVFGMMLAGLYVGRRHIFRDFEAHRPLLRRVLGWGLGLGLVLNTVWVWASVAPGSVPDGFYDLLTRGVRTIGGSLLTLGYVSGVVLLAQRAAWHQQLSGLAAVGRMALTNYILQSVVCTLLFYGYGLGVYGELGPFLTLLLTLAIFRVQIVVSNWWLRRYRFGPLEWVWRTMTYGRRQPLRAA